MVSAYEPYAREIAGFCESSPHTVLRILDMSAERRTLYHGVKRREALPKIAECGGLPNSPEGGLVSWWTTGLRLFLNRDGLPTKASSTYDTSFFDYSHNDEGMSLLVTDYRTLRAHGIEVEWLDDTQITIPCTVPPEAMSVLDLVYGRRGDVRLERGRKCYVAEEQNMLEMILCHLEEYSTGKIVRRVI